MSRKDVESQDASSEALKCELMVLCVDAMIVPSNAAMKFAVKIAGTRSSQLTKKNF